MRTARGLSQAELGRHVGVGQRRIAAIEATPGRASFDQVAKIIAVLGGQLLVGASAVDAPARVARRKTTKKASRSERAEW
jgi:predicted transcriptional regulator